MFLSLALIVHVCSWRQIGRILEDLDALAGNIAFKHCSEDPSFPLLVTASVDRYLSVWLSLQFSVFVGGVNTSGCSTFLVGGR